MANSCRPGGDGPIQAKHYVQEIVSTSMPCLMNLTVSPASNAMSWRCQTVTDSATD